MASAKRDDKQVEIGRHSVPKNANSENVSPTGSLCSKDTLKGKRDAKRESKPFSKTDGNTNCNHKVDANKIPEESKLPKDNDHEKMKQKLYQRGNNKTPDSPRATDAPDKHGVNKSHAKHQQSCNIR